MSNSVDQRIVQMEFDNSQFKKGVSSTLDSLKSLGEKLKFKDSGKGLEHLNKSLNSMDLSNIESSLDKISGRFTMLGEVAENVKGRIVNSFVDMGQNLLREATIQPVMDGLNEYGTKLGSVQTIMTNTKWQGWESEDKQMEAVTATLDKLNGYADKTIYNFAEMTRNIGTFTAAGVDLDKSATAIQGIANLAAASGSNSQQASVAMYQMSQALSAGAMKLQDWNSVVNAGMGGKLFQDALKETADLMYQTGDAAISATEAINKNGSFRESLQEGWITADVLTRTLRNMTLATEGLTEAEVERNREMLKNEGYSDAQIEKIFDMADAAQAAATKVKSFDQLIDTTKEALGSGWAETWEYIIGNLKQAQDLFTPISDFLNGIISESANARNAVLKVWSLGDEEHGLVSGRDAVVRGLGSIAEALIKILQPISKAFGNVFHMIDPKTLIDASLAFEQMANSFKKFIEEDPLVQQAAKGLEAVFTAIFTAVKILGILLGGSFMVVLTAVGLVFETIGIIVSKVAEIVSQFIGFITSNVENISKAIGDFGKTLADLTGIKELEGIFRNVGDAIAGFLGAVQGGGVPSLDALGQSIGNLIGPLKDWFSGVSQSALSTLHGVIDFFASNAPKLAAGGLTLLKMAFSDIAKALEPLGNALKAFRKAMDDWHVSGAFTSIKVFADGTKRKLTAAFSEVTDFSDPKQIEKLKQRFAKAIRVFFYNAAGCIRQGFISLAESIKEVDFGKAIGDAFSNLLGGIGNFFKGIGDIFAPIGNLIPGFDSVKNLFESMKNVFQGPDIEGLKNSVDEAEGIPEKLKNFFNGVKDFNPLAAVGEAFGKVLNGVAEGIKSFVNTVNTTEVRQFISMLISLGFNAGAIYNLYNIAKAFKGIASFMEGVGEGLGDIFEGLGDAAKQLKKNMKAAQIKMLADSFKQFAISILIIVAAITILTYIDHEKLYEVLPIFAALIAIATVIPILYARLAAMEKFNFGALAGIGMGMLEFAISIGAMLFALVYISRHAGEVNIQGVLSIVAILGGFLGIAKVAEKINPRSFGKIGRSMRTIAISLMFMWAAIELLGHMSLEVMGKGIGVIAVLLVFLGAMAKFLDSGKKVSGKERALKTLSKTFKSFAAFALTTAIAIAILGSLDIPTLAKGIVAIGFLMLIMVLMAKLIGSINKTKGLKKDVSKTLLAMAVAVGILAAAIALLAVVSMMGGHIFEALFALVGIMIYLAGVVVVLSGLSGKVMITASSLLVLALAIAGLAAVLVLLSVIDINVLANGFLNFILVLAALFIALGAIGIIGEVVGLGLLAVMAAFAIFGVALIAIAGALYIGVNAMGVFADTAPRFMPVFENFVKALAEIFKMDGIVGVIIGFSIAMLALGAGCLVGAVGLAALGLAMAFIPNLVENLKTFVGEMENITKLDGDIGVIIGFSLALAVLGVSALAAAVGFGALGLVMAFVPDFIKNMKTFLGFMKNITEMDGTIGIIIGFSLALAVLGVASLAAAVGLGALGLVFTLVPDLTDKLLDFAVTLSVISDMEVNPVGFIGFALSLLAIGAASLVAAVGLGALGLVFTVVPDLIEKIREFATTLADITKLEVDPLGFIGFALALVVLGGASLVAAVGLGALGLVVSLMPGTFTKLGIDISNFVMLMITSGELLSKHISTILTNVLNGIGEFFKNAITGFGEFASGIAKQFTSFDWVGVIKDVVTKIGTTLIDMLGSLVENIPGMIGDLGKGIADGIGNVVQGPIDWLGNKFSELTGQGGEAGENAYESGKAYGDKLANGLNESAPKVDEAVNNMYDSSVDATEEGGQRMTDKAEETKNNLLSKLDEIAPENLTEKFDADTWIHGMGFDSESMGLSLDNIKDTVVSKTGVELPNELAMAVANGAEGADLESKFAEYLSPDELTAVMGGQMGQVDWTGIAQSSVDESVSESKPLDMTPILDGANVDKEGAVSKFVDVASAMGNGFNDTLVKSIKPDLSGPVANMLDQLKQTAKFNEVGDADAKATISGFNSGSSGMYGAGANAGSNAAKGVSDQSQSGYDSGNSVGGNIGQGLVDGLSAMWQAVYDAGFSLGRAGVQGQADGAAVQSPSRIAIQTGGYIGEGLVVGMQNLTSRVKAAGSSLGEGAVLSLMAQTSGMADLLDDIDDQPTIRPVLDLTDYEAGIRKMSSLDVGTQTVSAQWANRIGGNDRQNGIASSKQNNVYITLDWHAGTTPNQMIMEMANALQIKNLMEA